VAYKTHIKILEKSWPC